MLDSKVLIERFAVLVLPPKSDDPREWRGFDERGELTQILNRVDESFKHLTYWDLARGKVNARGKHYHKHKKEHVYVLTGAIALIAKDLKDGEVRTFFLQALEYSTEAYDKDDTIKYDSEELTVQGNLQHADW